MPAPQTPFELSGKTIWTPLEDEQAYVDSLLAYAGSRLTYEVVGTSANGSPIRVFKIGTGPRRMMWTAHIHGNEPASREVMYTTLRQWVDRIDTDPAFAAYLQSATVLIMPTCNPYTFTSRRQADGIDINRDFLELAAPETRIILGVYRDFQPELVVDWHEFHASYAEYSPAAASNPNADSDVVTLATDLFNEAHASIQTAGYTSTPYSVEYGPDWFINNALVQGSVTVLMETSTTLDPAQRHTMHLHSAEVIRAWHEAHLSDVQAAVAGARGAAPGRTDAITLQMQKVASPPVVDPVPGGYFVTPGEWVSLSRHRTAYVISGVQASSGFYLQTAQPQRTILAYLVDPASPAAMASGEAMDAAPVSPDPVPIGTNVSFFYRSGGRTLPATIKAKALP